MIFVRFSGKYFPVKKIILIIFHKIKKMLFANFLYICPVKKFCIV